MWKRCPCNYFVGSSDTKDVYELYAAIQNWLLALYEHFIHVCCLTNIDTCIHIYLHIYCICRSIGHSSSTEGDTTYTPKMLILLELCRIESRWGHN